MDVIKSVEDLAVKTTWTNGVVLNSLQVDEMFFAALMPKKIQIKIQAPKTREKVKVAKSVLSSLGREMRRLMTQIGADPQNMIVSNHPFWRSLKLRI